MRFALLVLALAAAAPAAAEELAGVRALALQGGRASPSDNASIFLNPAGTALAPRYDFTAYGALERATDNRLVHLSLVDSKTSAQLGAGVGWNRGISARRPTDDIGVAVSQKYPLGAFGVGFHYRTDRERVKRSDMNGDSGFVIDPWEGKFKAAVVSYNLFDPPKGVRNVHRRHAVGFASRWLELFEVTADGGYNPGQRYNHFDFAGGVEVTPDELISLRASYGQFPTGPRRQHRAAGGFALILAEEGDLGYTYRQTIGDPEHATHAAEVSLMFF